MSIKLHAIELPAIFQPMPATPSADELLKLDEALGRLVPGLYADQEKVQRALADIKTRLALAEKNLRDYDAVVLEIIIRNEAKAAAAAAAQKVGA